jgi:prepilin-type N-terminal cleavage/methylation domain-containing protein
MRNKKSAFSLIEISIVVLIIGILVAGITQSSRLIASSRIATAQSLTQSSPVSANNGLMLWLETSSEASLADAQSSDGAAVTTWNDINTQSISKLFANTVVANSVTYKAVSPIGGLPSLQFTATSTGMEVSNTAASFTDAAIQTAGNSFSFFVVSDDESTTDAVRGVFQNGAANTGFGYTNTATASTRAVTLGASTTALSTTAYARAPEIVSATYDGTTLKTYRNGGNLTSTTGLTAVTPTGAMFVGGNATQTTATSWVGYISEIIIFNNALKDDDRKSIEQYLSKKYGIKVS